MNRNFFISVLLIRSFSSVSWLIVIFKFSDVPSRSSSRGFDLKPSSAKQHDHGVARLIVQIYLLKGVPNTVKRNIYLLSIYFCSVMDRFVIVSFTYGINGILIPSIVAISSFCEVQTMFVLRKPLGKISVVSLDQFPMLNRLRHSSKLNHFERIAKSEKKISKSGFGYELRDSVDVVQN